MSQIKKPTATSLLNDLKSQSLLKGRNSNYKMYMKKVSTNSLDKSDLLGLKNGSNTNENNVIKNLSIEKKLLEKRRNMGLNSINSINGTGNLDYSRKNLDSTHSNNNNNVTEIPPNKIDIKISVNYGKNNTLLSNNTHNTNNTNVSSNLSTSKSKSFYQNSNVNFNQNNFNNEYSSLDKKVQMTNQIKEKLIRSLKTTILDEKLMKKKIMPNNINNLTSSQSSNNIHKRNQSDYYQNNNLNISLMNYENKMNKNNISNNKILNENNSFIYNPGMYTHFNNETEINHTDTVIFETTPNQKIDTMENINLQTNSNNININPEFTLNRNDNNFLQICNTSTINKTQLTNLELKMEEMLNTLINSKKENKKENLIQKKLNVYKNIFEDYIKIVYPENNSSQNSGRNVLIKLNDGFSDTFNLIFSHFNKINEKMNEYETITQNYKTVSKKYSELYKSYQHKNEEIKILNSKLNKNIDLPIPSKNEDNNFNKSVMEINNLNTSTHLIKSNDNLIDEKEKEILMDKNNRSRMISMINKNCLDDLDSIYFFDKIDMRANSATHKNIPKLDLNFLQIAQKQKKKEDVNTNTNSNNLLVNMNVKKNPKIDELSYGVEKLSNSNNTTANKNYHISGNKISYHNSSNKYSNINFNNPLAQSANNYNYTTSGINKKLSYDDKKFAGMNIHQK